jgi:hypothetical protein
LALTGRTAREGGYEFRIDGVPAAQAALRLRAAAREMIHRSNAGNDITFAVSREHANGDACIIYIALHKRAMDEAGRQLLTLTFSGGVRIRLADAVVTACTGSQTGVRSVFNYGFAGGLLT